MKVKIIDRTHFSLVPETQAEQALMRVYDQRTWVSWVSSQQGTEVPTVMFEDQHYSNVPEDPKEDTKE